MPTIDEKIRVLILEDVPSDAALVERELRKEGLEFVVRCVESKPDFVAALADFKPDVVLSDYSLPSFSGMDALRLVQQRSPTTPLIIVTGSLSEETAAECIKAGAADYVLKERLPRLPVAVRSALERRRLEEGKRRAEETLRGREEIYSAIVNQAADGIVLIDPQTLLFVEFNDAACQGLGYTREEFGGVTLPEVQGVPALEDVGVQIAKFRKLGGGTLDTKQRRKDGTLRDVHTSNRVVKVRGHEYIAVIWHDVTERRRADEALRESEERFRQLAETMPDGVVVGQDGRNVYANSAAARLLRAAGPEELVGLDVSAIVDPAKHAWAWQQMQHALAGGMQPPFEDSFVRLDGSLVPVEIAVSLLTWQGRPAIQVVMRDITARKKAEEDLRKSKQIIEGILNAIPVRVFWKDKNLVYLGCNAIFARDAGFADPKDLIGKDDYQMVWHDQAELYRDNDRQVIASGFAKLLIEEPQTTPEGNTITLLTSKLPLRDSNGEISGLLGTFMDITELKRAEEAWRESEARYRSLFEQSPLGIYQTTPDGKIVAANAALLWALGYTSLEELTTRNLDVDGYEPRYSRREFKERIERDGEVIGFESAWLKKDGQVLAVRESARVVRDQDGKALYYEGTIEDVTAQRRGEEERRRLVAAIEQASETIVIMDTEGRIEYVNPAFERTTGYTRGEAIGNKLTMLESGEHDDAYYATLWQTITQSEVWQGHFVNRRKDGSLYEEEATVSPIRDDSGAIVSFVEVKRDVTEEMALQAQLRQAQKMEAVGMLAGGVAHDFNNLLQGMLNHVELVRGKDADAEQRAATMAELEAEIRRGSGLTRQLLLFARRETAKPEQLDLNEVIGSAATFLRRLVRVNVAFSVELADEPLPVTADRGQIDQVLMNLVVNAADAMPGGGRLTIRSGSQGREWVWFAADDTGSGIPVEIRERIFEPFFTTKSTGKGTGLGLSVVHGIVTQHHGVVEFEDLPEGGTSFRITLPRAGSGEHPEVVLPTVDASGAPGGHGERVLVVEDEEGARQGLAEILRMLEYEVVAVGSGEEAGLLPSQPGFDVLLTDMMLPGIAGGDLARGLLDRWPELKVILMSGYTEDEAVRRGALAGRIRFLQKPFDMASLAREIRAALDDRPAPRSR
ncbi:MAG: PAS domain S-box protein [Thermoanaerobaculaceae bacterium]|jgi:PAS domain S-box-containing protein